jgi:biopolymer transport protein ExbD
MAIKMRMPGPMADINVTPMADVMLVLLIIFMVITPMLQKGVSVDMAKAENPRSMQDADKEDAVVLAITRDGKVYLGSDRIQLDEITAKVKDRISSKLDKTVYVKSDARAKYGDVVAVVDNVRAAGVDALGLLTEKLERKTPGVPAGTMGAPGTITP